MGNLHPNFPSRLPKQAHKYLYVGLYKLKPNCQIKMDRTWTVCTLVYLNSKIRHYSWTRAKFTLPGAWWMCMPQSSYCYLHSCNTEIVQLCATTAHPGLETAVSENPIKWASEIDSTCIDMCLEWVKTHKNPIQKKLQLKDITYISYRLSILHLIFGCPSIKIKKKKSLLQKLLWLPWPQCAKQNYYQISDLNEQCSCIKAIHLAFVVHVQAHVWKCIHILSSHLFSFCVSNTISLYNNVSLNCAVWWVTILS